MPPSPLKKGVILDLSEFDFQIYPLDEGCFMPISLIDRSIDCLVFYAVSVIFSLKKAVKLFGR